MATKDVRPKKTVKRRELANHGSEITIAENEHISSENDKGDTEAQRKDYQSRHLCCWHECHKSLVNQRYALRDDHHYCMKCYENLFANTCEKCNKVIGLDSKNLSHNGKHWHKACFKCSKCRISLVGIPFGLKEDKMYCGNCYDSQFAAICDGCNEIIRFGTKKMEYKTRKWHGDCFTCSACKTLIGNSSFFPKEQDIYCSTCYEEKYATKCVKCKSVITSYGITYRNESWHRRCFTCTNCKENLSGKQFTSRDEKPYCPECYGKLLLADKADNDSTRKVVTVGVFIKNELPEKQVKNFLQQIFNGEMRLKKKS